MDDFDKEIEKLGQRIREIRKHRKLTLLDLEVGIGIANGDLSKIERGLQKVEVLTIYRIAKGLNVEMKALYDYDGPLPDNSAKK